MRYLILILLLCSVSVYAQRDEFPDPRIEPIEEEDLERNNQEGDLNTNNQNSNNNNRTTTNIGAGAGEPTPVMTAIAPSLMSQGSDTCLKSKSGGIQLLTLGLSGGSYKQDEECNRRRDAKLFKDLGMTIAAVSRMCQNEGNWKAMFVAGTPCPILVKGRMVFGKNAVLAMKTNPETYIPDYRLDKEFYDSVLAIGGIMNETEENANGSSLSISERFRSSRSDTVD
jgi:hypothetical protein